MALRIFDTLTGEKQEFAPREEGKVGIYVCGVTVYDLCHVGHARVYVAFDVVQRWLRRDYEVTYVRNFTDVDDKIIKRANENEEDPIKLADRFIAAYHEDMDALGVAVADVEPRVSTHMKEIVDFVDDLVKKNVAYRVPSDSSVEGAGDDVYYRVGSFEKYTELSRRNLDDMVSGARVTVDERKESPLDFALWKSAKEGEPWWDSPFGKGRPGWHIECSAMSEAHLGTTLDIHGGGKDLIFPHHTNEIAQSEARHGGEVYSRYWMHNGFVNVRDEEKCAVTQRSLADVPAEERKTYEHDGETFSFIDDAARDAFIADPEKYLKMSKSLGNFFTIRDIFEHFTPEALRWLLLGTQYRNPIAFSPRLVEEAERRVAYVYETVRTVEAYLEANEATEGDDLETVFSKPDAPFAPWSDFSAYLDDDFCTPGALATFQEMCRIANLLCTGREKEAIGRKLKPGDRARLLGQWQKVLGQMQDVLRVGLGEPKDFLKRQRALRCREKGIEEADIDALIKRRFEARAAKDWDEADKVRAELTALGIEVRDLKDGCEWSVAF